MCLSIQYSQVSSYSFNIEVDLLFCLSLYFYSTFIRRLCSALFSTALVVDNVLTAYTIRWRWSKKVTFDLFCIYFPCYGVHTNCWLNATEFIVACVAMCVLRKSRRTEKKRERESKKRRKKTKDERPVALSINNRHIYFYYHVSSLRYCKFPAQCTEQTPHAHTHIIRLNNQHRLAIRFRLFPWLLRESASKLRSC